MSTRTENQFNFKLSNSTPERKPARYQQQEKDLNSFAEKVLQPPLLYHAPELQFFAGIMTLILKSGNVDKTVWVVVREMLTQFNEEAAKKSSNESAYRLLWAGYHFVRFKVMQAMDKNLGGSEEQEGVADSLEVLNQCIQQLQMIKSDQATALSCLAHYDLYRISELPTAIEQAHLFANHCRQIDTNTSLFDFITLRYVESLLRQNQIEKALSEARQFAGTFPAQYCNLVMFHCLRTVEKAAANVNKEALDPLEKMIEVVPGETIPSLKKLLKGLHHYGLHMFEKGKEREDCLKKACHHFDTILDRCCLAPSNQTTETLTMGLYAAQLKAKVISLQLAGCSIVPHELHKPISALVRVFGICIDAVNGRLTLYRRLIPETFFKLDKPLFDFEMHSNVLDWYEYMTNTETPKILPKFWKARVEELWPSFQPAKIMKVVPEVDRFAACDTYCRMIERVNKEDLSSSHLEFPAVVEKWREALIKQQFKEGNPNLKEAALYKEEECPEDEEEQFPSFI